MKKRRRWERRKWVRGGGLREEEKKGVGKDRVRYEMHY